MAGGNAWSSSDPLAELVRRAAEGEEAALAELYDATSRRVYGLARKILRDRESAEEATLDAYLQLWRQAGCYDPSRGDVLGWLLTLTRSRAIDLLRTRSRRENHEEGLARAHALSDPGWDPERASAASERAEQVRVALAALPAEQRDVIEAAYFEGLSHSEVASSLGQPLGTVKTRIRSGMSTLRRLLEEGPEGAQ
jgi:RNA polymerase sigma-70 factor (ECF subfamily)